jgi:uncharacterized protein YjbI with pentapeptide repeats
MTEADCEFFSSGAWDDQLRSFVGRAWNVEVAISRLVDDRPVDRVMEELAESTDMSKSDLYALSLQELIDEDDAAILPFTIDDAVSEWKASSETSLPEKCPHPADDSRFCVFHRVPSETSGDMAEHFQNALNSGNPDRMRFTGARIGQLDLSHRTIDASTGEPLDLRFAKVGELDLSRSVLAHELRATGLVVERPHFVRTTFHETASFSDAILGLQSATPQGETADVMLTDNFAEFGGDVSFRRAVFDEKADFKNARFGGDTSFNSGSFRGIAMFNYAEIAGGLDLMHAEFERKADFSKATVGGYAVLNARYRSNAMFNYTTFEAKVDLWNVTFEGMVDMWATTFKDRVDFQYGTYLGYTSFKEVQFQAGCDFTGTSFEEPVVFDRIEAFEPVTLAESTLLKGRIIQPADGETYFDLHDATLGDVRLQSADDSPASLDKFYFLNTEFEGFDFARHRDSLRPDWQLETFAGGDVSTNFAELESTYLRAKNGASKAGDGKAASEFFLREMRYRRKLNWQAAVSGDSLFKRGRSGIRWLVNWFYNVTIGYGERPLRAAGSSLVVIFLFAIYYWLSSLEVGGEGFLAPLTFSLQTFVTLIFGSVPSVDPVAIRFIAAIEAFIGAFFIALFVFALTRSIHR